MNKILIKILIVIWSIIAVTFTVILVHGIVYNKGAGDIFSLFKGRVESSATVQNDKNVDLDGLNKINVNFSSSEIVVQTTDEPNMRVVQKSFNNLNDDEKFIVTKKDNEVTIKRTNSQKSIFNFGNNQQKIEVYIPENYDRDLNVESSSGNVDIDLDINLDSMRCITSSGNLVVKNNINAKEINLKTSSGSINAETLTSKTYNINASSGNIDINSLSGSGELQSSSGSIRVKYNDINEYSNISASSGDVNLIIPADLSFEFNGKCTSGNIRSDFDLNYKSKKENEATGQIGSGPYKKLNVNTNSGDISISN